MFCGNTEGNCFVSYVVYKSENMWTTWTENGPVNARYNRTKSGWFDSADFEDQIQYHFLSAIKNENGTVTLIDDNLSSHISTSVIQLCEKHNIKFECLPPNTTHMTQPLDVAKRLKIAPMKRL